MKKLLNKLIDFVKKDGMLKGFSVLFSGTIITQIISILLSPILTRLYSPELYGINSVYISVLTIAGVIATLRLQVPIAISNDLNERNALTQISIFTSILFSVLLQLSILVNNRMNFITFDNDVNYWIGLLPFSTMLLGIHEILFQNLLSSKMYRAMSYVTIIRVVVQGLTQILFSFTGYFYIGLILGNIISYIMSLIYMIMLLRLPFKLFKFTQYKSVLKKNIDYPKFAFPAELASMASFSIVPIVISFIYSPEVTGFYALANKLIGLPIGLFGNSMRQVFIREASIEYNTEFTIRKTFLKTTKLLSFIAIPSAIVLYISSPFLISLIFGSEWQEAGLYIQVMMLFFLARFIVGPLTSAVNVVGKQKVGLYIHVVLLIGIMGITLLFETLISVKPSIFLLVFSFFYGSVYFAYYCYIYKNHTKEGKDEFNSIN